jgi:hypothetical protein
VNRVVELASSPRCSRWRLVLPELAGIGAVPAWRAMHASVGKCAPALHLNMLSPRPTTNSYDSLRSIAVSNGSNKTRSTSTTTPTGVTQPAHGPSATGGRSVLPKQQGRLGVRPLPEPLDWALREGTCECDHPLPAQSLLLAGRSHTKSVIPVFVAVMIRSATLAAGRGR